MVKIPTPEEILNRQWQEAYQHFAARLKERYSLDISFKEYHELCSKPVLRHLIRQTKNSTVSLIQFKGTLVVVGKSYNTKAGKIRTALPLNKKFRALIYQ